MTNPTVKTGVCGRYRFTKITVDENDNEVDRYQTPWIENIITDNGLDLLGKHKFVDCFPNCYLGDKTSPSTPSATDTQLQSQYAKTSSVSVSHGGSTSRGGPSFARKTATFHFGKGDAKGTATEVGVGVGASDLFSRALILDGGGSPTSFVIGQDDKLDVEYEFRAYFDNSTVTGTYSITNPGDTSPTSYSYTLSWQDLHGISQSAAGQRITGFLVGAPSTVRTYDGSLESPFGLPSGSVKRGSSGRHVNSYVNGTHKKTLEITLPASSFNYGSGQFDSGPGIKIISVGYFAGWYKEWGRSDGFSAKIEFSPTIPKTKLDEFKITLSISWDRYTPPSW